MSPKSAVHSLAKNRRAVLWAVMSVAALVAGTVATSLSREDIRFWDESTYLERGLNLGFGSSPGWEWNPIYSDTYWMANTLFNDPITAYFFVRALTASMLVIAVWTAVRLFSTGLIALAAGAVMVTLPVTYVWPGVSTPSVALLIFGLACAWRFQRPLGWLIANAAIWLAAATRPEFVYVAFFSSVVAVASISVWRGSDLSRVRRAFAISGVLLPGIILALGYGTPFELGTRSWEAFTQHYEYRFAVGGDDPWQIGAAIVEQHFPGAASIPEAIMAGPIYFLQHVMRNILTLPLSFGGHLLGLGGPNLAANLVGVATSLVWWVGVTVAALYPWSLTKRVISRWWTLARSARSVPSLLMTLAVLVASSISLLVVYPRPHYLLLPIAAAVGLSALLLQRTGRDRTKRWLPVTLTIALAALGTTVVALTTITSNTSSHPTADALRRLNADGRRWTLLTPERPIAPYLSNAKAVEAEPVTSASFGEYLESTNTNLIYDGILFRKAPYANLKEFESFIENPGSFGFFPVVEGSSFLAKW